MFKFLLIFLTCLYSIESLLEKNPVYKCNYDGFKNTIRFANVTLEDKNSNKIFTLNSFGFKTFNICLDLYNFDYEINKYNLQPMRNFFLSGLTKAKTTLEKLLKVKLVKNFVFTDEQLLSLNITKWDPSVIGNETINGGSGMLKLGIDLYLFVRFKDKQEMGENVLASAGAYYVDASTYQPLLGIININREVDYSKTNSLRYLEGILVHEMTHVLGF